MFFILVLSIVVLFLEINDVSYMLTLFYVVNYLMMGQIALKHLEIYGHNVLSYEINLREFCTMVKVVYDFLYSVFHIVEHFLTFLLIRFMDVWRLKGSGSKLTHFDVHFFVKVSYNINQSLKMVYIHGKDYCLLEF